MLKQPAIREFIKVSEIISLGLIILILLIIAYPGDKNKVLLFLAPKKATLPYYELSSKTSKENEDNIINSQIENKKKSIYHQYHQALAKGDYISAKDIAKKMVFKDLKNQIYWLIQFEKLCLIVGDQKELIDTYFTVFKNSTNYDLKKHLFVKIIRYYQAKEDFKGLKNFLNSYYKDFIKDEDMAYFILKTTLSLNNSTFSQEVALNIKKVFLE